MRRKLLVLPAVICFLFSCKKEDNKAVHITGSETAFFTGKAHTELQLDNNGVPDEIAISIDNAAFTAMPVSNDTSVTVPVPSEISALTPFQTVMVGWNPHGHPPVGVYDKPHFDFHFYMVPESDVMAAMDSMKLMEEVPTKYLPVNYFCGPSIPMMGKHYIDSTSGEFAAHSFTQTFIYGAYAGEITFYEPMITLDFLKATTDFQRNIPVPAHFKRAGNYPTQLKLRKQNGRTEIILSGFVAREAS